MPTIIEKQKALSSHFATLSKEESYNFLLESGKHAPLFPEDCKTDVNRVLGCQSLMYLSDTIVDGNIHFKAFSEALISAGLAQMLIDLYSGHTPQEILQSDAQFMKELHLDTLLSPGRANGLNALYQEIKKRSLRAILNK